ncbi:MAG: penicillin acylase family protein [Bacteroidetes bacterium]|nr:MAG: penicillin acylase family protein [Bacteroidota bacterium]
MFKKIAYIAFSLVWITASYYSPMGILKPVGALLSYNDGIFHNTSIEERPEKQEFKSEGKYQLEIRVDSLGIPHIFGKDAPSLAYGVGYMHARDRYFQMELITRTVQGQLSSLLGTKGVESDRFWLKYQFDQQCKKLLDKLAHNNPEVYRDLVAYSNGVRHYLKTEMNSEQSPEYKLLGENPRQWKDHYPLLLSGYMSYMLCYDDEDAMQQQVIQSLPPELYQQLYAHDADLPYSIVPERVFGSTGEKNLPVEVLQRAVKSTRPERTLGSNNWAISPSKSSSGNAILCNDTHLDLVLPSPWYEIHVSCPEYTAYGLSIPCGPYIISGFNEHISWGMTNAYWDENDEFLLECNSKDSLSYQCNGRWEKMEVQKYQIPVKSYGQIDYTVTKSKFGFVEKRDGKYYAKTWYPATMDNTSFISFRKLCTARNWGGFLNAMKYYAFPPQNFAFADVQGNTGMLSAGKLVRRPQGYQGGIRQGKSYQKPEFIPFEQLPQHLNPERGYVASANQLPAKTNYYVNHNFSEIYRIRRIHEYLGSQEKFSRDELMKLQADNSDLGVRDLIHLIKQYPDKSEAYQQLSRINEWNGVIRSEINEPILASYLNFFVLSEFDSILMKSYPVSFRPRISRVYHFLKEHEEFQIKGKKYRTEELMKKSYQLAYDKLKEDFEGQLDRALAGPHRTFFINHLLRLPGWGAVIQDAGGNMNSPNVHKGIAGPSMRTVIEMNPNGIQAFMIIAGGQSGRANTRNYRDQLVNWKTVQYHPCQHPKNPSQLQGIQKTIVFKP